MGLRFRRSIRLPFGGRYTVSASSKGLTQSTSIGVKGARVTLNSRGQQRTTLSLPGTGVSYVRQKNVGSKAFSKLVKTIVVLFMLGVAAMLWLSMGR